MKITILLPHYGTGRLTAYTVSKLLEFKGNHEVDLVVIDNNSGDGSIEYLNPFMKDITIIDYPKGIEQSHSLAFELVLPLVKTAFFLTVESDCFATKPGYLDYYIKLIDYGYDAAGSLLKLSGGTFLHPAATLYKTALWKIAKEYCQNIQYSYFPSMSMKDGFSSHLMVHNDILENFLLEPENYIELSDSYKPYSKEKAIQKRDYYSPVAKGAFHNGMGRSNESVNTYGFRDIESEVPQILLTDKPKIVSRVGYEPGQWLHYWMLAERRAIYYIPTEIKWMEGHENRQQEYTINEAGMMHTWAGSAHLSMKDTAMHDVYEFKKNQVEELYNSLPEHQKIKI